jgi:hypothetical protein
MWPDTSPSTRPKEPRPPGQPTGQSAALTTSPGSKSLTIHAERSKACWDLAARPEYSELRLPEWSHMLGYRGHFLTKSLRYSTTLSALRQARADHRAAKLRQRNGQPDPDKIRVIYESEWRFAGSGHREGEAQWAEATREQVRVARTIKERQSPSSRPP